MVLRSPQVSRSSQSRAAVEFASSALRAGNIIGARQALQNRLAQDPSDAEVLAKLAEIATNQNSVEEATLWLERAAAADPSTHRRIALIEHLQRSANPARALAEIERLPTAARTTLEVAELEAAVLGKLGLYEREVRLRQRVVDEHPSEARNWCRLATALRTVGKTKDAVKALKRATRAARRHGEAWWHLANLKSYHFSAADVAAMHKALRHRPSDEDCLHIHFALGKALEDCHDYEQSFRHYAAGNAVQAKTLSADQASLSAIVDASVRRFTPEFFRRNNGTGSPEQGPIFVVGLHRSGSTLIEQILASHSMIEPTGELPIMANIWGRLERESQQAGPDAIAALVPEQFKRLGEEYLERSRTFRKTDRAYFVDKMPGNWVTLALIRLALPNSKIIDARRHPMACGFSNFKQHYPRAGGFSYRLGTIGRFYYDYWRFMRHFDEVQPGAAHRVINERLVDDPVREIRGMLDYLGLRFEASCLAFHDSGRAVRTPSAEQVRRPINSEGVDRWRHYEPWLGELKQALGPALDSWAE